MKQYVLCCLSEMLCLMDKGVIKLYNLTGFSFFLPNCLSAQDGACLVLVYGIQEDKEVSWIWAFNQFLYAYCDGSFHLKQKLCLSVGVTITGSHHFYVGWHSCQYILSCSVLSYHGGVYVLFWWNFFSLIKSEVKLEKNEI